MSESQINKIHNNILNQISKIYDQYEQKSRQMKEQSNKKTGSTIEKAESDLIKKLETILQPQLEKLVNEMEKVKILKGRYSGPVKNCHNTIKSILKKKSFNFKINKQFNELYDETLTAIKLIKDKISVAEKTTFLCCGTDGQKEMEAVVNVFKIQSGKWEMIQTLEPKGSVDNYICPQFVQTDYDFIRQLIRANWPKEKQARVQEVVREVIKEVKVPEKVIQKVYVNVGGKSNQLDEANQHIFGINREENVLRGLEIYHEEAEKNQTPEACAFLARAYEQGILVPRNLAKSAGYYQKAVEKKHKYAMYRFAMCLIKGTFAKDRNDKAKRADDIKKAYALLKEIASAQDPCPEALAELGMLFQHGYFSGDWDRVQVEQVDLKKAIAYNEKAKSMDLPRAMNNLGLIYYNNKHMNPSNPNQKVDSQPVKVQNTKRALSYFFEAQKHGYPEAYFNLGVIHKEEKQPEKAIHFFYQGARKNDYLSKIKFAYELMNQTSIEKEEFEDHYRLAQHWLEEVIQYLNILEAQGSSAELSTRHQHQKAEAMFYMGLFYEHGFGVEKSPKRAFNYFLQASELSYAPAKNKIGDCYFSGYAVPVNRELAIGCYLESEALGDSDAMVNLGTIYLNGIPGVIERNYSKAHEYFCKSMELENSDAMIHLSYMYRNGLGLDSDDQLAKKLLEQAAKNKNSTALYMLKERGQDFNKNIYYDNLENQFPFIPKRIDITEVVPVISTI